MTDPLKIESLSQVPDLLVTAAKQLCVTAASLSHLNLQLAALVKSSREK